MFYPSIICTFTLRKRTVWIPFNMENDQHNAAHRFHFWQSLSFNMLLWFWITNHHKFLRNCFRSKHFCTKCTNLPMKDFPATGVEKPSGKERWQLAHKGLLSPKINFLTQFGHETDVELSKIAENLHAQIFSTFTMNGKVKLYMFFFKF